MKKMLKFWGTRGSCAVSGPEYLRFGGNTTCVEVVYQDTRFIIDAGSGIRPLGLTLLKEKNIDLFLSHFHWDHILGFPFFEPIYKKDVKITIWAPHGSGRDAKVLFDELLSKEFFPVHLYEVQATLEFQVTQENKSVQMGPLTLDFQKTHHPGLTYGFKIKTPHQTIGFASDNEIHIESQKGLIEFFQGCDVLIHEAQYSPNEYERKRGWGHASLGKAIQLVNAIKPGKWLVTHHDPEHTDADLMALEKIAKSSHLVCPVEWIPDGHVLNLN